MGGNKASRAPENDDGACWRANHLGHGEADGE